MDIKKTQVNPLLGVSTLLATFLFAGFLYSGHPLIDCIVISAGLAACSLGIVRICTNCGLDTITCCSAAIMFTFSPFVTEIAILSPFTPLITALGVWSLIPWVSSMTKDNGNFGLSFIMIVLPPLAFAGVFTFMATPEAMNLIDLKTFFPLPVSEPPYPAFASISNTSYTGKLPVAVSYMMLIFAIPGFFRINFETALFCIIAAVFAVPAFDKPYFNTPPAIWAIYPILAISILSANGVGLAADWIEAKYRIRPIWIFIIPILEVLTLAYMITY